MSPGRQPLAGRQLERMSPLKIALAALAVWRLTHLLNAEDGPFRVFDRFRSGMRRIGLGGLVDCFYCLSLWMAAPFALWLARGWMEQAVLWLALSAIAILINRCMEGPTHASQAALYYEEPEPEERAEWHVAEEHDGMEPRERRRPPARSV